MIDHLDVDGCIDDIVATCNGDLRGALKALMLVNEQLERELHRVSLLQTHRGLHAVGGKALH